MRTNRGFTLVEVLVALAIITIALTAIMKSASQNTRNTLYVQHKAMAAWVGLTIMNQARLGLITLPDTIEHSDNEITLLRQKWNWQGEMVPTKNKHIREMHILVFDPERSTPLIQLTGYRYVTA